MNDLRYFQCLRCGGCCRPRGVVRLRHGETEAIADLLGMDARNFADRFTRLLPDRSGLSLQENDDGTCVFLSPQGCRIQAAKPGQCRDFPLRWNEPGWENRCAWARGRSMERKKSA